MLSKEYDGSICEVKGLNNTLIATGTFRFITEEMLEVVDEGEHLPMLAMDSKVKIIVHNNHLGIKVLLGQVYLSNHSILRVKVVESFVEYEHRRFFRQSIDHSATLLSPAGMTDAAGEPMPAKLPIRVKDVSLCGLLMESRRPLSVGDELKVSMTLINNELETMKIAVRRIVEEKDGKNAYGCEVMDLSPRLEQRLNAFVMEQQRRQIRRSRR